MLVYVTLTPDKNINKDDIEFKSLFINIKDDDWNKESSDDGRKKLIKEEITGYLSNQYKLADDMLILTEDKDKKKIECTVTVKEIDIRDIVDVLDELSEIKNTDDANSFFGKNNQILLNDEKIRAKLFLDEKVRTKFVETILDLILKLKYSELDNESHNGLDEMFKWCFPKNVSFRGTIKVSENEFYINKSHKQEIFKNKDLINDLKTKLLSDPMTKACYFDLDKITLNKKTGAVVCEYMGDYFLGFFDNEHTKDSGIWIMNPEKISDFFDSKKDFLKKDEKALLNEDINNKAITKSEKDLTESYPKIVHKIASASSCDLSKGDVMKSVIDMIKGKKEQCTKIVETYQAPNNAELIKILLENKVNENYKFTKVKPDNYLFVVLAISEGGPDRGHHITPKWLRKIIEECEDFDNEPKNKDKLYSIYTPLGFLHRVLNQDLKKISEAFETSIDIKNDQKIDKDYKRTSLQLAGNGYLNQFKEDIVNMTKKKDNTTANVRHRDSSPYASSQRNYDQITDIFQKLKKLGICK